MHHAAYDMMAGAMTSVGVSRVGSEDEERRPSRFAVLRGRRDRSHQAANSREVAAQVLRRMHTTNRLLSAELEASMLELRESRARLMSAAVQERRRIERDLHDGAQQRLVAAQVRTSLARDALDDEPERGKELLERIGVDLEEALEELRSLAHGLYPAVLSDRGIAAALREAARHTTLAVTIDARTTGRYCPEIESAVYFCCLEALQNAAKHAQDATGVRISLAVDDELRFEVTDNGRCVGPGAAPLAGAGLTNMHDRLAAVGGRLDVRTAHAGGIRVRGTIPLAA
jgi:signal transduction histidine kinase